MTLTLILDNIPAHQRAAALAYGRRDGNLITIDAADLFRPAPATLARPTAMRPPEPIPDDTSPEIERRKAKAGGCCGEPSTPQE
jgi:hypothetical protein